MRFLIPALASTLLSAQSAAVRTPAQGAIPIASPQSAHPELAQAYRRQWAPRLQPLLSEVLRFPTVAGNEKARADQQAWLLKTGKELGFTVHEVGKVTEIELPGPAGAPVLGLIVHGDVQPVDDHWSIPPFEGAVKDGVVLGRGAADDKGPLVQALLAMKTLAEAKLERTYAIRLLVGSDEESSNLDFNEYLADHKAPDLSLVLDSAFPVVVGEKAWNALTLEVPSLDAREPGKPRIHALRSGLAASIVPDLAMAQLDFTGLGQAAREEVRQRLVRKSLPFGCTISVASKDLPGNGALLPILEVTVRGRASHAGVNAEGGRNALTALAGLLVDESAAGAGHDLLAFAKQTGKDLVGTGLGLTQSDPVFGRVTAVPTLLQAQPDGKVRLTINLRSTPALSGEPLKQHLFAQVEAFNTRTGAKLEAGGFFGDRPLAFDPNAKLVKRLLADYARATGKAEKPAISGGNTYAKRVPNAIAFGMWFPGKPYPGHDVDEKVSLKDLHLGVEVLLEALADLACSAPLKDPFKP
jgi:predicted dipeptidase